MTVMEMDSGVKGIIEPDLKVKTSLGLIITTNCH